MLNNIAEKNGWHKFISMQNFHNLLHREDEREMHPYCNHAGIGLIPWSPLNQGSLARPWNHTNVSVREQTNLLGRTLIQDSDKPIVDRLEQVAKKLNKSMATVAIAWSLKKGVNPILGLSSIERIDEAVETVHLDLSDEDEKLLDELYTAKPLPPVY
jgi:aryl-alcohol dehydrogenase-like predicted oxidoreductase